METSCYLCGSLPNHSYDCPKYVSPNAIISYAKFVSRNDGKTWRIAKILKGQIIPEWATHAWYLNNSSRTDEYAISKDSCTVEELSKHWANAFSTPLEIVHRYSALRPGDTHSNDIPVTVFAVVE